MSAVCLALVLSLAPAQSGPQLKTGAMSVDGRGVSPMGKQIGVGIQLGFPTALSLKYMLGPDTAVAAGIGAGSGFFFDPLLSLHADYLWHPNLLARGKGLRLSWFVGIGGWVLLDNGRSPVPIVRGVRWFLGPSFVYAAARVPIGLNLALNKLPLEFSLDVTPSLLVVPELAFGMGLTLGARFYF